MIWMTTFFLVLVGSYLIYDSINIVATNKSKISMPLIFSAGDTRNKLQRKFHNEITVGAIAIFLGLMILEISYIDFIPKAIAVLVLYLITDVLGYLRTE